MPVTGEAICPTAGAIAPAVNMLDKVLAQCAFRAMAYSDVKAVGTVIGDERAGANTSPVPRCEGVGYACARTDALHFWHVYCVRLL